MANERSLEHENWKRKYLEALEELENKERDWLALDDALRRGLNRLSLISVGVDTKLDTLMDKLRRGLKAGYRPSDLDEIVESISQRVKVLDQDGSGELNESRAVLLQVLESVNFPNSAAAQVDELRHRLIHGEDDLNMLIDAFSQLVISAFYGESVLSSPFVTDGSAKDDASSHETPVEYVFLELLSSLAFSKEFSDRVNSLKEQISNGLGEQDVSSMTGRIIELVVDMRAVFEHEKLELESFLLQLTQRLAELDTMLAGAESTRRASLAGGRQLDAQVKAQVSDIEHVVQNASDLDQMKSAIQVSLDVIRTHLADQREKEELRQHELEAQLKTMTERLKDVEAESESLRDRLDKEHAQAVTDALTGAPNRLAYEQRIEQEYSRWQRYKEPFSMLLMDVDHFKRINDTYGHKAGDRALIAIVKTIEHYMRETDFVGRIGGEEFAIIFTHSRLGEGQIAAEKLRTKIERCEFEFQGNPVPITVSGGITEVREGDIVDDIYDRADKALYAAKGQGRNCIVTQ